MKNKLDAQMERSATVIAYQKFQLLKNKNEYAFFFVEGEDDLLYYPLKARGKYNEKQIMPLHCGGKKGVLEIHEMTKDDISEQRVIGYFIDRDFDDNSNVCNTIYVTPSYAVENLVYNKTTYVNYLHERFNLNITDAEYTKAMCFYQKLTTEFYEALSLYNAWMFTQRNLCHERKNKSLSFPKNIPDDFIHYSHDQITACYTLEDIKNRHENAPEITNEEIEISLDFLTKEPLEKTLRGKFHWAIFSFILSYLIEDANKKKDKKIMKNKVKFTISKKDSRKLFEEIHPFSTAPNCLDKYFGNIAA
ncbi:DUF4435 domain-containing protein [Vibrio sp. 1F263]|uniref:DUF4435 domain-containing protein n=1 Tax=Vibrio sp. 1F263 TaxID=3230012 RepID=UPI00352F78E1